MNVHPPLPTGQAPLPYIWRSGRKTPGSDVTAFDKGLEARDQIDGTRICVVCGETTDLEYAHIIPQSQQTKWRELRARNYVPPEAKDQAAHEPRNGVLFCTQHYGNFDNFRAFIRYIPSANAYIWLEFPKYYTTDNGKGPPNLIQRPPSEFHGKKLHLDPAHPRAPIYSLFLIHECIARGHHPFLTTPVEDGLDLTNPPYASEVQLFLSSVQQGSAPPATSSPTTPTAVISSMTSVPEIAGGGFGNVAGMPAADVEAVLKAARSSNTWKSCVCEGIHFDGSTQDNIEKYAQRVGFEFNTP
ncbi:hypothetical protein B0H11DRAFT_1972581 [Mycena galericulata]|nr:hypothetical protein B0H11DRAFT_1972581 [Mycena galericulata]